MAHGMNCQHCANISVCAICGKGYGTATTGTTGVGRTFTPEDWQKLERQLSAMAGPQWTLIAPDGKVWVEDSADQLLRVLAVHCYTFLGRPQA